MPYTTNLTRKDLTDQIQSISQLRLFEGLENLPNDTVIMKPLVESIAIKSEFNYETLRRLGLDFFVSKGWLIKLGWNVHQKAGDFAALNNQSK